MVARPARGPTFRFIAAACVAIAPHVALAAEISDVSSGLRLSELYCIDCHVVVPSKKSGWTDAPAFDVIANRPGSTVQSLGQFIKQPHMHMLNIFRPEKEAHDIAAYIISLRKT
jgi:hypothetical protein